MHRYTCGCKCIGRHLKGTVLWGTITLSEMGKQNIQAKKVCFIMRGTVVHYTLFLYIFLKVYYYFQQTSVKLITWDGSRKFRKGWLGHEILVYFTDIL